jgi:hypothetical protein
MIVIVVLIVTVAVIAACLEKIVEDFGPDFWVDIRCEETIKVGSIEIVGRHLTSPSFLQRSLISPCASFLYCVPYCVPSLVSALASINPPLSEPLRHTRSRSRKSTAAACPTSRYRCAPLAQMYFLDLTPVTRDRDLSGPSAD